MGYSILVWQYTLHCIHILYGWNITENDVKPNSTFTNIHIFRWTCFSVWKYNNWIAHLQERTRAALLDYLHDELHKKNIELFGALPTPGGKQEGSKFNDFFKRALSGKSRSHSIDSTLSTSRRSNGASLPPVGEDDKMVSSLSLYTYVLISPTLSLHLFPGVVRNIVTDYIRTLQKESRPRAQHPLMMRIPW